MGYSEKDKKSFFWAFIAIIFVLVVSVSAYKKDTAFYFPKKEQKIEKTIEESALMKKSTDYDWWLNSGGEMHVKDREFSTNTGALPEDNKWRKLYSKNNYRDTDNGYYPQNIFRLVTRRKWKDFSQTVYFMITNVNLSSSPNRNESNGILFFNRYQNGDNLYYAGIRVDGDGVIKKKIDDKYYTLKEKSFFSEGEEYDKKKKPCLIPLNRWVGMRSEIRNLNNGTVDIKFYIDPEEKGEWQLVLETIDRENEHGSTPFVKKGYAGIRTDFMDVKFKDYSLVKL